MLQAESFVGAPLAAVAGFGALSPLPTTIQYLYPDTPDYYYRYGDGYLYQVDRSDEPDRRAASPARRRLLPGPYLPHLT